jgi:hypothetical protein
MQDELLNSLLAEEELKRQDSVMTRPQQPAWRKNLHRTLGPTLGTGVQAGMDLLDALLAFGPSPLDAAGPSQAVMVPASKVFHGTPFAYKAVDMAKASKNLGPSHFVTTSADLAGDYAKGMFMDSTAKAGQELAPNIRPYMMKQHNSLISQQPVGQTDLDSIMLALRQNYNPAPRVGKHGTVSSERQRENLLNEFASRLTPQSRGSDVRESLTSALGLEGGEDMLRKAGFQSIQYAGEEAGSALQQATKVLDPGILDNLFDALSRPKSPFAAAAPTSGPMSYYNLPRAGRSMQSPTDLLRALRGEELAPLGSALPSFR